MINGTLNNYCNFALCGYRVSKILLLRYLKNFKAFDCKYTVLFVSMLCKTRTKNSEVDSKEETALDWLQRLDYEGAHLKIGNSHFDRLKIRTGELIEIVGGDATGKMQLGMTLIAEQLLSDRECKCLVNVIDFNGSFRIDRLTEILSSRRHHYDGFSGCDFLDRVKYSLAKISTELESRLHELKILLKYSSSNSIVFINKIGSILFNAVAKENIEGNTQMRILKELEGICQDFGTTIITTNHIVDWRGYQAPALGKIWIKGIETRIFLNVDQTGYFAQMTTDGKLPTEAEKIPYSLSQKGFDVPIHPYPI